MKNEKLTITIEVEGGSHRVAVRDSAGNEKVCGSILLVAGSPADGTIYSFAWGNPLHVAASLGETLARGQGDEWWSSFTNCHCRDMAMRTMPIGEPTTIDQTVKRSAQADFEAFMDRAKKGRVEH